MPHISFKFEDLPMYLIKNRFTSWHFHSSESTFWFSGLNFLYRESYAFRINENKPCSHTLVNKKHSWYNKVYCERTLNIITCMKLKHAVNTEDSHPLIEKSLHSQFSMLSIGYYNAKTTLVNFNIALSPLWHQRHIVKLLT